MKALVVEDIHTDCSMKGIDFQDIDEVNDVEVMRGGKETAVEYYERIKNE